MPHKTKHEITVRSAAAQELSLMNNKDSKIDEIIYKVNPQLIHNSKVNKKTTLRTIEPYRLKALVIEDLLAHPMSIMNDIAKRLPDVDFNDLKKMVRKMAANGEIKHDNGRKYRRYYC